MGSRANVVLIRNGTRRVFYSHSAGQHMDEIMMWGPEIAELELSGWQDVTGADSNCQDVRWLDNAWAEGGACIDFDTRHLVLCGGEDIECDVLWIETYLRLLRFTWRNWTMEWSWGKLGQIARYAGVDGKALAEIECDTNWSVGIDHLSDEWIAENVFTGEPTSTLSIKDSGSCAIAFVDSVVPESLLSLGDRLLSFSPLLTPDPLDFKDFRCFLMGGLHIDEDSKDIFCWRTWNADRRIVDHDKWSGYAIHDLGHDYRAFYQVIRGMIRIEQVSEGVYIDQIRKRVTDNLSSTRLSRDDRTKRFDALEQDYFDESPFDRYVPCDLDAEECEPEITMGDVLMDGEREWIENYRCPMCGRPIHYRYSACIGFSYGCKCFECRSLPPSYMPNCVVYFGDEMN
ncbi:hypothetical protein [Raoultibacter phocaeensis]|uniref:hypothetical protein n=1 Tax=Raoultibacter phocaeensis TaxID=2479841 RepID=UPI00111A981C|nr:hypothetical protein [Raoultibacter phocaeensis]